MSTKTLKKGINIISLTTLTLFAVILWTLNFIGTNAQRKLIELIFAVAFIPACLIYAKFYFCTERKRVQALQKKRNYYKKKRQRS